MSMRPILPLLIVGYLAQQASPDLAVVEGRLLHQGSSAPIANASISLARLNPNMPETSEAINLAQGVAVLMRNPLASSPGVIDGFLVPNSEVVGVSPDLLKPVSQTTVKTDDRGVFRLGPLAPGEWFVGAANTVGPVRGVLPAGIAPTYFPGVADPVQASPVIVRDDLTYDGIDFALRPFTPPTYKVSGTIINKVTPRPNSTARSSVSLYLVPQNPSLTDNLVLPTLPNVTTTEFEIPNVKSGIYDLYATSGDVLAGQSSTARTTIVVRDSDLRGILLTLVDGGILQGEIFIDGNTTQDTRRERFSLRLQSADSMPGMQAVRLGSFRFNAEGKLIASNVPIARYSLEVLGLPPGAYVSDIRQSGQSVYNDGVLIEAQQNSVQITVKLDGATIFGVVRTEDRKPAATANVILVPPVTRRGNPMAYKTAMTDDAGRFSLAGVMPGTYTILALKSRPYSQPWLNPAFISRYEDRARVVRVETRGTAEIQLPLISD
jgi:hypothetical protein